MNSTSRNEQPANSWIDQYHAALGQRASRQMVEEVRHGNWVGRIPLGYIAPRDSSKRLEIDPEKAELIRTAFGLAASPQVSLRELLRKVTALGMTGHNGKAISLSSLHHLLSNPFYSGRIRFKGDIYSGNHPAIVTLETFQRVQKNLSLRQCG